MTPIEKLFRKISRKEREFIVALVDLLISGKTKTLRIEKLSGGDLYKVRKGHFRLIFHYENKAVIIDAIRLRNEKTYRNF